MATHGLLKKVWDNEKNWGLVIDVDEHGEHKLTLWDKKYAGIKSNDNPAICDCHAFVGQRIVYTATKGALKDKDGPEDGERWGATVTEIELETSAEKPSDPSQTPSSVHPAQVVAEYNTARMTRLGLEAVQADMRAHEARAAWFAEVERLMK